MQACTDILPATINLPAIKQHWQVRYISQQHKKIKWLTNLNYDLILIGNIQDKKICLSILQSWLKSHASHYLTLELEALRHHTNLSYTSVIIRNNKTRWGSCSSQGKISLSSKLLFLPYALMRHVLLHELCHLKYLNHGQKFWQLLQSYDDKSAEHIQQLKKIKIPIWVENKL